MSVPYRPTAHFQSGLNTRFPDLNRNLLSIIKDRDLDGLIETDRFRRFLKEHRGLTVFILDLGSAEGLLLYMFTQKVAEIARVKFVFTCVDPNLQESSEFYEKIREQGHEVIFVKETGQKYLQQSTQKFDLIMASHVAYYFGDLVFADKGSDFISILRRKLRDAGLLVIFTMSQACNSRKIRADKRGVVLSLWNVEKVAYGPVFTMKDNLSGYYGITAEMLVDDETSYNVHMLEDCYLPMLATPDTYDELKDLPAKWQDLNDYQQDYLRFITRSRFFGEKYTDAMRQDLYEALLLGAPKEGIQIAHPCWMMLLEA